jgi:uncharacterized protein YecE (DUF72 family)
VGREEVKEPSRGKIRIGCSGWQYAHWRGDFYPAELPTARWFAHYALTFDTVEINNSFSRLPPAETFAKWREQASPLVRFFDNARQLGPRLGPILYQLPPRWPVNLDRFEIFLRALPRGYRHTVELRETS